MFDSRPPPQHRRTRHRFFSVCYDDKQYLPRRTPRNTQLDLLCTAIQTIEQSAPLIDVFPQQMRLFKLHFDKTPTENYFWQRASMQEFKLILISRYDERIQFGFAKWVFTVTILNAHSRRKYTVTTQNTSPLLCRFKRVTVFKAFNPVNLN